MPRATSKFLQESARLPDGSLLKNIGDVNDCIESGWDIGLGELEESVHGQIGELIHGDKPMAKPTLKDEEHGTLAAAEEPALFDGEDTENANRERKITALIAYLSKRFVAASVSRGSRELFIAVGCLPTTNQDRLLRTWILTPTQAARWWTKAHEWCGENGCYLDEGFDATEPKAEQ